ncbi:hypothetical protein KCU65_g294, partial [Aureobasidium melanogenum]
MAQDRCRKKLSTWHLDVYDPVSLATPHITRMVVSLYLLEQGFLEIGAALNESYSTIFKPLTKIESVSG